jgi:hypothetical protein
MKLPKPTMRDFRRDEAVVRNSAALRFIQRDDMEAQGNAPYLNHVEDVR